MMKKLLSVLLILTLVFPANLLADDNEVIPNTEAGIPDKGLYNAILKRLGKSENEDFTKNEVMDITVLDASYDKRNIKIPIKSLKGIDNLLNLEYFNVSGNQLTTLSGIEKLSELKDFIAYSNNLTDLKGIGNTSILPVSLSVLNVSMNQLTTLSGIENLTDLNRLSAAGNKLTSLEGIEKFAKLTSLDIGNNKLISLKPIDKLSGLLYLLVHNNKLTSLNGIENSKQMKSLYVSNNNIKKLPDLRKHTELLRDETQFLYNKIAGKEFDNKLPTHLLRQARWLDTQKLFQNVKETLKIKKPKTIKKITVKTKKIIGKTHKNAVVMLKKPNGKRLKTVYANKKGIFTFKKLKLKKWRGKKLTLQAGLDHYHYDWGTVVLKTIKFKIRRK